MVLYLPTTLVRKAIKARKRRSGLCLPPTPAGDEHLQTASRIKRCFLQLSWIQLTLGLSMLGALDQASPETRIRTGKILRYLWQNRQWERERERRGQRKRERERERERGERKRERERERGNKKEKEIEKERRRERKREGGHIYIYML